MLPVLAENGETLSPVRGNFLCKKTAAMWLYSLAGLSTKKRY